MRETSALRSALGAATSDRIILDLGGIVDRHDDLVRELPGVAVRFAVKACPVDDVLDALARAGAGFDAASPNEIIQALRTGVPPDRVHHGNTIKSDRDIAVAYQHGVRLFATDSIEDVRAIATHAPGSRVFCRLTTTGAGALWALTDKCGCTVSQAVEVLAVARAYGLIPAGLSLHVGSQQMTVAAWRDAFTDLSTAIARLDARGIRVEHVNLGGGLPALGYLDRAGRALNPPFESIVAAIRDGLRQLRLVAPGPLDFVLEPGRHLVADQGAIRAHVVRLTERGQRRWLYLSCGRFNGLYELDQIRYRLEFPTHPAGPRVPARVAGPTCDSDDVFGPESTVPVPAALSSGDPVWIRSAGAYSVSYTTVGFNGFDPLPIETVGARAEVARAYLTDPEGLRSIQVGPRC